jgi:hypothetical protein
MLPAQLFQDIERKTSMTLAILADPMQAFGPMEDRQPFLQSTRMGNELCVRES